MVQRWPKNPQNGPLSHFMMSFKAHVHFQSHVTHTRSHIGHSVITRNLVCIAGATSLHRSAQMVPKRPKSLRKCDHFMILLPLFGFGTQPMCILSAMQLVQCHK